MSEITHVTAYPGWWVRSDVFADDCSSRSAIKPSGGARRDRTDDLMLAKHALSQLSYSPFPMRGQVVGLGRLELPTSPLSGVRSSHLSYRPAGSFKTEQGSNRVMELRAYTIGRDPRIALLRKEVIQPQVLLRLPCYDFTPIMSYTLEGCSPCGLAHLLLVQPTFVM